MKRLTTVLIFLALIGSIMAQINVAPGMKMPEVKASYRTHVKIDVPDKGQKFMDIVVFSDINSQDFIQTLHYLESLKSKFRRSNDGKWMFQICVIVPNDTATLERFINAAGASFTVPIGSDINGKTFRNFLVAQVPSAVIGIDGAIAWLGPVMDLDSVITSLISGTFSQEKYKELSRMKMEMQTALRAGLPDVAAKTAEKILVKEPGDMTAIQLILYSYELKNQSGKAVAFLESCVAKCGNKAGGIRLLLLERIIRSRQLILWQKTVDDAIKYTTDPDDKLNLAAFLVDMSPRFYFPAEQVPALCAEILKMPGLEKDPSFHANALEIAARAEFAVCRIEKAIAYQKQAIAIRTKQKSPLLKRCQQALEYYNKILKLSGKK